jgi:hypothetical protein
VRLLDVIATRRRRRPPGARSARAVAAACLLLGAAAACQTIHVSYEASTVRVVVAFDPAQAPTGCTDLVYEYTATRTGDAPDTPTLSPGDDLDGDESASDTQQQKCSERGETFSFPDNARLKAGVWTFTVAVRADGVTRAAGTCPAVTTRSGIRHVVTFTQPPAGTAATCTFSL